MSGHGRAAEDVSLLKEEGAGRGPRGFFVSGDRLTGLERGVLFALPALAVALYFCKQLSGGAAVLSLLADWLWAPVLPALMLLAARFSLGTFTAACLLAYGGRAVLDVLFSLTSGLRSAGTVGLGSLLYVGLGGLILPLLLILALGIGMQLIRLVRPHPAVLALAGLSLTGAVIFCNKVLQTFIASSLYAGSALGGGSLGYLLKSTGLEWLPVGLLFILFFTLDYLLHNPVFTHLFKKED